MEQDRPPTPICTIKMNLRCCEKCPIKLKEKLQKLNGVDDINIDPEQGLLRVLGNIDPMALTKIVQSMDKKAELWSFQKQPSQKNIGASSGYNIQIGKDCSCDGDEAEISSDEERNHNITVPKKQNGILTWAKNDKKKSGKGFSGKGGMPMPRRQPRPPMGRPSMGFPAHKNFYGLPRPGYPAVRPYYQPPPYGHYGAMRPPPSPYGYFQSRSPPRVNPIVHYNSYADNYRYT